jgi:hypothetical protein
MHRHREAVFRFMTDRSGSVTVEFVIVIPLLFWCFVGTFTFFDAYRTQMMNLKAAYIIGDQLSRETGVVVPAYIDGLGQLHQMMVGDAPDAKLRVTAFQFDGDDDSYRVIWSRGEGQAARTAGASITDVRKHLPEMGENEVHILTETWVDFRPADMVGMPDMTFSEAIVTRMRTGRICWKENPTAGDDTAVC